MRLFFFLAAVLITAFEATELMELYDLPRGFPDGTLITIFFKHSANDGWWGLKNGEQDHIRFYFYDIKPELKSDGWHIPFNIPAFLRIERGWEKTVYSDTKINKKWVEKEEVKKQMYDIYPPAAGWWRVDVMKLDKYRMNVFFQGFWADVRTFDLPLDNINFFHMKSKDIISKNDIEVYFRYPNSNLVPPTFHQFMEIIHTGYDHVPRTISTLPGFPMDGKIELSVVMRTSNGQRKPLVGFVPSDGTAYFLRMFQQWSDGTHKLSLGTYTQYSNGGHPTLTQCTFDWSKPNGELVHLAVKRIRYNVVEVRVLYKNIRINSHRVNNHAVCWIYIPDEVVESMDRPFRIQASYGAIILHIDRSYPDQFPESKPNGVGFYNARSGMCIDSICRCCDRLGKDLYENCENGECPWSRG